MGYLAEITAQRQSRYPMILMEIKTQSNGCPVASHGIELPVWVEVMEFAILNA